MKAIIITCAAILLGIVFIPRANAQTAPVITYPGGNFIYALGDTINPLVPANTGGVVGVTGLTSTTAGTGASGYWNGAASVAKFNQPLGVVTDPSGNVYVADVGNEVIRKITPAGIVSTVAGAGTPGSADGVATAAKFYHPVGMCSDAAGNIYVADENNNMIRKMTPAGVVTTIGGQTYAGYVDGASAVAKFNLPCGVAVDAAGNVYVADYNNNAIRKIAPDGSVSTFAGSTAGAAGASNGTGTSATFNHPYSIAIDAAGNLYVADRLNNMIRKITPAAVVTTLAGQTTAGFANATGTAAQFNSPVGLAVDAKGNVYVADQNNNQIRVITASGLVTTLSGTGAQGMVNANGSFATFYQPYALTADAAGHLFVCDYGNNVIRQVIYSAYTISPSLPAGLAIDITTGIITGIPAIVTAGANYTVTAYSSVANSTTSFYLDVNPASVNFSANQNCVVTYTPRISGIFTSTSLLSSSAVNTKVETNIQYLDGLGRPLQTVQYKGSPTSKDVIQPFAYDQLGRDSINYLPYTIASSSSGSYQPGALSGTGGYTGSDQYQFYQVTGQGYANTAYPSAASNFEPSPLNRVIEKGAPGTSWQLSNSNVSGSGHTVKVAYLLNNAVSFATDSVNGMQVARYSATVNSDNTRTLVSNGYYDPNKLTVTVSKDENWVSGRGGTAEEYKDSEGRVVLKRQYNFTAATHALQMLSTYYVYDDFGHLAFVMPPAVTDADQAAIPTQATLSNSCYQYLYDLRGRLIQKRVPGKGWESIVYNAIDQPVAMQDAVQQIAKQWVFTKYDQLGRPVETGIWDNGGTLISPAGLQNTLSPIITNLHETATNTGNGYSNVAWPTTNITATLSLNYYDNYNSIPNLPAMYTLTTGVSNQTRSLPTAKLTAVLNNPGDQLWDVMYYDDLGRATKTYAQHYLGGTVNTSNYDVTAVTYNFNNAPTTTTRKHWNTTNTANPVVTIYNRYTYDWMGRKQSSWEQFTNANLTPDALTLVSKLSYDEIGQLRFKKLYSTDSINFAQTITYGYNERGWLLNSSAPLFAMNLYYNTTTNKQYNGNIAYQFWGVPGNLNNHYSYTYDQLNRLTSGVTSLDNYQESGITYDLIGNITALNRYQAGVEIDQLSYAFTAGTKRLSTIIDNSGNNAGLGGGTTSFTFDSNGNMLSQTNTGYTPENKSFSYNLLNLPLNATFNNGTASFAYDALGNKLRKIDVIGGVTTTTDYITGIQYVSTPTADPISFIQTEEGRAIPSSSTTYNYEYTLADNLGNTRVTFDTGTGTAIVVQKDDYYPFGMDISRPPGVPVPPNNYLYNKKELQTEFTEYDYGARFYDPVIARWTGVDPKAEVYHINTPYAYTLNNPVKFVDPNGMEIEGETTADAKRFHDDINDVFAAEKFAAFRALIQQSGKHGDGYKFKKIDSKALATAIGGLKGDDLVLAKLVAGEINSRDVQTIEYTNPGQALSQDATTAENAHLSDLYRANGIEPKNFPDTRYGNEFRASGGGQTFPTTDGAIAVVLETFNDYSGGRRSIVSFHELFGHGVAISKRLSDFENDTNAIRLENLVRRVLGITDVRDGHDHAGGVVPNPTALPVNPN